METASKSIRACRLACAAVATCFASAGAAGAADDSVRALAAGCLTCHQPVERTLPVLAGQPQAALADKLRAFRSGTQAGTVMPQIAKGYTDAQIDAIAGYFAEQRTPP